MKVANSLKTPNSRDRSHQKKKKEWGSRKRDKREHLGGFLAEKEGRQADRKKRKLENPGDEEKALLVASANDEKKKNGIKSNRNYTLNSALFL